jgi:LmbE family N-acetylglucosaminyl deacetylase/glycosyltransferase involved in cell wall biosynthesis
MASIVEADLVPYSAARTVGAGPALVLAPHPDDEVLGCGGAILCHRAAGDPVSIVVATDGGHGEGVDRAAYVRLRQKESEDAARALGCEPPEFWDLPDRSLEYGEKLIERIAAALVQTEACILYAPSPDEVHPDHHALGLCALEAVRRSPREIHLALYEVSTPLRPNLLLDITDLAERKQKAIACFPSQLSRHRLEDQIRALNTYRTYTLPKSVTAAEAYCVLTRSELRDQPLRAFTETPNHNARNAAVTSPLISVVVRTTGRDTLDETLRSIDAQTYPRVEVVLVDAKGGLQASLASRGGRFPLRVVSGPGGLKRSAAANSGLDAARGDLVAFVDDDDWIYPHHLAHLEAALRVHRYARAAYAGIEIFETQADGGCKRVSAYNDPWDPTRLLCENYIPMHAVLFHRSLAIDDACRFDEALDLCEDWDFWIQLARHTAFVHLPEPGGAYRLPGGSALYDGTDANARSLEAIFAKWNTNWNRQELLRLWNAARNEHSPNLRRERAAQVSRLHEDQARMQAEQARLHAELVRTAEELRRLGTEAGAAVNALAAVESELRLEKTRVRKTERRAESGERRADQAEQTAQELQEALAAISSSSAVRAARLLRSLSPRLHAAVGKVGRALFGRNAPDRLPSK